MLAMAVWCLRCSTLSSRRCFAKLGSTTVWRRDVFYVGLVLYEGVAFPTNHEYGHDNLLTKTQKRVCTEPTAWTEAYKHPWDIYIRSGRTLTAAGHRSHTATTHVGTTISLLVCAKALWHRLSRAASTLSARTKSSAVSDTLGEHAGGLADGARQVVKKNDYLGWAVRQHAGCMAAGARLLDSEITVLKGGVHQEVGRA